MNTKLLGAALFVSAALLATAQAGGGHHGGISGGMGGVHFAAPGGSRGGGGIARSGISGRSFGGSRMMYSGQRFSPSGISGPSIASSHRFSPTYLPTGARQFTPRSAHYADRSSRMSDRAISHRSSPRTRLTQTTYDRSRSTQFTSASRTVQNVNRGTQLPSGTSLRSDWRNHVYARHSTSWHRDWDRNCDHWWNGHRCHFLNGSWIVFDYGFYPWWPSWYYPYDYYAYGYPSYYDSGYYGADGYYGSNGYTDPSSDSIVASVQDQLAREGYYHGQIDGVPGPETRAALARYQTNHGLQVSGSLTPDTLQALGLTQVASY